MACNHRALIKSFPDNNEISLYICVDCEEEFDFNDL
jgi:hypothetical protein